MIDSFVEDEDLNENNEEVYEDVEDLEEKYLNLIIENYIQEENNKDLNKDKIENNFEKNSEEGIN